MAIPMPISVMCIESPRGPCDLFLEDITTDCTLEQLFASIAAHLEISKLSPAKITLSFENGQIVSSYHSPNASILQYGPASGITCRTYSGAGYITLFVCGFDASYTAIMVQPSDHIEDVKFMIQEMKGISSDSQRLLFAGKELKDNHRLSDYNVRDMSTILMVKKMLGGGSRTVGFVDVAKTDALRIFAWNIDGPVWRIACDGLSIEGYCTNSTCAAYKQVVISIENFEKFDLINSEPSCPLCHTTFAPIKPGFSNCWWRLVGIKSDGSQITIPWKKAGDAYTTYDEAKAGMATFKHLNIEVRPLSATAKVAATSVPPHTLPCPSRCCICHGVLSVPSASMLKCTHCFHQNCIQEWLKIAPNGPSCPLCRSPAAGEQDIVTLIRVD